MYSVTEMGSSTILYLPRESEGLYISFSHGEVEQIINRLLTRKERNNGLGRGFLSRIRWRGYETLKLSHGSSIICRPSFTFENKYEIVLRGDIARLLQRLNFFTTLEQAQAKKPPKDPYQATGTGHRGKKKKTPRALGNATKLHHHFKNHELKWDDAMGLIARACKRPRERIKDKLIKTLDTQGVASLRISKTFVIRVDIGYSYKGCLDILGAVELWTTDDNTSAVYRRLRILLKRHFDCMPKVRQRSQANYLARKREEKRWFTRYCAA